VAESPVGALHHVELWVPDLDRAVAEWDWLLAALGYGVHQRWEAGRSWRLGPTHLAFHGGERTAVDALVAACPGHGWRPMFADRHPWAGGPDHYAGYLENSSGFEVELVATPQRT